MSVGKTIEQLAAENELEVRHFVDGTEVQVRAQANVERIAVDPFVEGADAGGAFEVLGYLGLPVLAQKERPGARAIQPPARHFSIWWTLLDTSLSPMRGCPGR